MTDREYNKLIKRVKKKRREYKINIEAEKIKKKHEDLINDLNRLHSIDAVAELEKVLVENLKKYNDDDDEDQSE